MHSTGAGVGVGVGLGLAESPKMMTPSPEIVTLIPRNTDHGLKTLEPQTSSDPKVHGVEAVRLFTLVLVPMPVSVLVLVLVLALVPVLVLMLLLVPAPVLVLGLHRCSYRCTNTNSRGSAVDSPPSLSSSLIILPFYAERRKGLSEQKCPHAPNRLRVNKHRPFSHETAGNGGPDEGAVPVGGTQTIA